MATPQEQFIVNAKGKKTGVLLSLRQYQKLMEDLHDLAIVAERRKEKPVTLEELKRRLRKKVITIHYVRHRRDVYRGL
jgi:PHD/YefM family antitoxin component YafN of YafNO toxin-antitoxin module